MNIHSRSNQAIRQIQQELGEHGISTDDEDLKMHGYSEWSSVNIDRLPVAVAFPKSTEEVAAIARICHKYKVPMSKYKFSGRGLDIDRTRSPIFWRIEC